MWLLRYGQRQLPGRKEVAYAGMQAGRQAGAALPGPVACAHPPSPLSPLNLTVGRPRLTH